MSNKRKKLSKLVFPDYNEWTSRWLTRSILSTPKWQINSVTGSYYYNMWIGTLATKLDGTRLPDRTAPELNYFRSMKVGIGVAMASNEYESMKTKVSSEVQNKFLKDLLNGPAVSMALNQASLSPVAGQSFSVGNGAEKNFEYETPFIKGKPKPEEESAEVMEPYTV